MRVVSAIWGALEHLWQGSSTLVNASLAKRADDGTDLNFRRTLVPR